MKQRIFILTLVMSWALLGDGSQVHAGNRLNEVMEKLAGRIANYLQDQGADLVEVGSFDAPSNLGNNLQIERRLREELAKQPNVKMADTTALIRPNCWSVRGSYAIKDRNSKSVAEVTTRIYDPNNVEQHSIVPFPFLIDDVTDLTLISAATFDATPDKSKTSSHFSSSGAKAASGELHSAIQKPNVEVSQEGRISPTSSSPYSIELMICDGFEVPPKKESYLSIPSRIEKTKFVVDGDTQGYAVADLRPGEFYAIKVYNDSEYDSAVRVCVDGLSSFEFTEIASYKKTDHWIIPKHSSGTIYGWHRTNDHSDSFEVAHMPETAVHKSGRSTSRIGLVQAIFFRAWSSDEDPPSGMLVRGAMTEEALGTKQGAEIKSSYDEVRRFSEKHPIASICVRYAKPIDDLPPALDAP